MSDLRCKQQENNWLKLLRSGDHDAFAKLIDEYQRQVFLCCRTLGLNEAEMEDVASETFLAVYKNIGKFRQKSDLGTWLWRIAYYKGVTYLRKNNRYREVLNERYEQFAHSSNKQLSSNTKREEQLDIIWRAVNRLPSTWITAIVLFYREGKNISEIAKIMRKHENTVKTFLHRGREKLRKNLA